MWRKNDNYEVCCTRALVVGAWECLSWSQAGKGGASRLSAGRQLVLLGAPGKPPWRRPASNPYMCPPLCCLMMQKIKLTGGLGQETLVSVTQGSVIESTSALVV